MRIKSMRFLPCLYAFTFAAMAQPAEPGSAFAVADVHRTSTGVRDGGLYLHANRLELHGATMLSLIELAYEVKEDRLFGGPNWLDTGRFEIIAKSETPVTIRNFRPMLQALLADRFQLKIRKEDKPEPIFVLTSNKRVPLKESAAGGDPQCKRANQDGYGTLTCRHVTMAYLAERLPGAAPNYFDHPVVDKTGISGSYDIALKWTSRAQLGLGDPDHPSISLFDFLEKQYGIKVEPQTRPAASLTIESVNETPSPNPPGTLEKLPPQQTEFEVAEIRPSKPGAEEKVDLTNGRLQAIAITMKDMIGFAYNLDDYMLPGLEKWMETERWDLIAKSDPVTTDGTMQAMTRTLLAERFHLKSHFEDQPVEVWALTAPKGQGKLKETNGEEHAGCVRTPKDGGLVYTCHNTTMAQLSGKLPNMQGAREYIQDHPLVDLTGLKGSYDFEFTWSLPGRLGVGGSGFSTLGTAVAATPTGGVTLYDAVEKQLGLKLSVEKHAMPVVVIDHVDRTPTGQ